MVMVVGRKQGGMKKKREVWRERGGRNQGRGRCSGKHIDRNFVFKPEKKDMNKHPVPSEQRRFEHQETSAPKDQKSISFFFKPENR